MEASARDDVRRACLGLIRAHFTNPDISQAWLAEQLHISRRQLNRCFEGGVGTGELLARRRLSAAAHLMRMRPDLPLQQLAIMCGYSTYETLRSQARRMYGLTPGELRAPALAPALKRLKIT